MKLVGLIQQAHNKRSLLLVSNKISYRWCYCLCLLLLFRVIEQFHIHAVPWNLSWLAGSHTYSTHSFIWHRYSCTLWEQWDITFLRGQQVALVALTKPKVIYYVSQAILNPIADCGLGEGQSIRKITTTTTTTTRTVECGARTFILCTVVQFICHKQYFAILCT